MEQAVVIRTIAQSSDIVGEGVYPNIYNMTGVKFHGYPPFKRGTGNGKVFQTGLEEVVDHFVLARVWLKEFRVFFHILDDSVLIFGKAEEIAFLLQQFHIPTTVGAFAVYQLVFGKERFTRGAVPAFIRAFVNISLIIQLLENFLHDFDMIVIGGTNELIIGNAEGLP